MLSDEHLSKLLRMIADTREEEMDCGDCYAGLDCFVDQVLSGKVPDEVMLLMEQHLKMCPGCEQEFLALLEACRGLKSAD